MLDALERPGGKAALGYEDFSSGPTVVTMPQVFRGLHARLGLELPALEAARPTTTDPSAGSGTTVDVLPSSSSRYSRSGGRARAPPRRGSSVSSRSRDGIP